MVPTDKTNSFKVISKADYVRLMQEHLQQHGKKISHSHLSSAYEHVTKFVERIKPVLSFNEEGYIIQKLNSKEVPTPKLLIKDHKAKKPNGDYRTRLINPANNFISGLPKLGYKAIKQIFDDNNIDYMPYTIIQALDLKVAAEKLNINPANTTIVSVDAKNYYPSIRYKLVKKAVEYFAKSLDTEKKNTIQLCLEMIKFGMGTTYLQFQDSYYEYDGDKVPDERGLTIGGYESAWLADMVAAYIMLETTDQMRNARYKGMYRDDGIAILKGRYTYQQIVQWRNAFQAKVNQLTGGDYLQYTCEVWADRNVQPMIGAFNDGNVTVNQEISFPYLDIEFKWNNQKTLVFQVHLKPNQKLQYLNRGSAHTKACFNAIPKGVCQRLSKLTTITSENANTSLATLYPQHFKALLYQANLLNKKNYVKYTNPTRSKCEIYTYTPSEPSSQETTT